MSFRTGWVGLECVDAWTVGREPSALRYVERFAAEVGDPSPPWHPGRFFFFFLLLDSY